jgi:hypothetical protein
VCNLTNTGNREGDEVLQVYHTYLGTATHPLPIQALVDFERVTLESQETTAVLFWISEEYFQTTDGSGNKVIYDGSHRLCVTNGYDTPSCIVIVFGNGVIL